MVYGMCFHSSGMLRDIMLRRWVRSGVPWKCNSTRISASLLRFCIVCIDTRMSNSLLIRKGWMGSFPSGWLAFAPSTSSHKVFGSEGELLTTAWNCLDTHMLRTRSLYSRFVRTLSRSSTTPKVKLPQPEQKMPVHNLSCHLEAATTHSICFQAMRTRWSTLVKARDSRL